MKFLLDTNILVAAVTSDSERSAAAKELLNTADDPYVSVLNLVTSSPP
jgi:predicted nucleic acid-binding protein